MSSNRSISPSILSSRSLNNSSTLSYRTHEIRPKKVQNIALIARLELAKHRNVQLKIMKKRKLSKSKETFV